MTATGGEGLAAALIQISEHAERIGRLDAREGEHFQAVSDSVRNLHATVDGLRGDVAGHAEILASLDGLDASVAELAAQVGALMPASDEGKRTKGYQPVPTVQWWAGPREFGSEERAEALKRIRDWVTLIYRPYYGHLAAGLGDCWEEHALCLVTLDWLSELWMVLELQPSRAARDLAAQAELGTRIVPAIAEQLAAETTKCAHSRPVNARAWSA